MKAMILAAGRGKRMRPVSDRVPKPLLEVAGRPLIDHHLAALANAGVTEVVINLSWLGDMIRRHVGTGERYGLAVAYSDEGACALETAGGIIKALPLLGREPFIAVNGDIFTDYPFARLFKQAVAFSAHLVLVDNPPQHERGDFALGNGGVSLADGHRLTFSGIAVYRPDIFADLEPGVRPLLPILDDLIGAGRVSGEHYRGLWRDVGTPARLVSVRAENG